MKIRLLVNLPIDPKFGMTKGTIWDAKVNRRHGGRDAVHWWVKHLSTGERIGVLYREAEVVQNQGG